MYLDSGSYGPLRCLLDSLANFNCRYKFTSKVMVTIKNLYNVSG